MWDFSKPRTAASKWRRPRTAENCARQNRTAERVRLELASLEAGGTVPVPERQRRVVVKPAAPVAAAEADALRDFLAVRGRDIAGLLSRTDEEGQLRLAGAYRAILVGQPGAHVAWGRLIASLGL